MKKSLLAAVCVLTLSFSACGSPAAAPQTPAAAAQEIVNCGRTQKFDGQPKRILSMNQHATEVLVALGVTDRIVGTAYPDTPDVPAAIATDYAKVKTISQKYPTLEQLLGTEPDLVVGGYASAFAEKDGRGRDALEAKGIRTFLLSENCPDATAAIGTYTDDLGVLGRLLGATEQAGRLIGETTRAVDEVTAKVAAANKPAVPVFFYDSGEQAPFTVGGRGLGNDLAKRAGGRNIFADVPKVFGDASWEQVGDRAPEVIVLVDYLGDNGGVDAKRRFLEGHPLAKGTPAVRNKRFVTLTLPDLIEGIRLPAALRTLTAGLHPDLAK
ncbi:MULTISPECIES: ABC transporter substrate-binding protein [unclassified Crossiella]|uniref:ABC transporter substrate-binding protein n=1 Tax=unclassified Crossiella TaxID=2620835 RepID=UPI0020004633|nr:MULTISPECIES: ABC transporter substrate-binding protein [unclassified Crossiella]MCK2237976.1 ABC transporter substrate-binding protein [Crossiella sp. S99.2]MCK2255259.1 ABC transporter substrate-binding protein [Crossiella sp. S99.1]